MTYNADMEELKRKYALWLSKEQAEKFSAIFERAKRMDGRTNYSEVIKELMGFRPDPGVSPVTFPEDREFLYGLRDTLPEMEKPSHAGRGFLDKARPGKILGRGKIND
ncbi:MAG: hypothetical protein JXA73_08910 [Acidobacteria bacterium]|nr:hypothetical protein [Acidobacteriota bacterium]